MKYIRTKDELGIEREDGTCCFRTWAANPNSPLKKDWLYADTIEELLDELIIHNPSNDGVFYRKHFVYQNKWETMLRPMTDYQKSKGIEIYGAIWTDKGLIFVAKMNDKGELELLWVKV